MRKKVVSLFVTLLVALSIFSIDVRADTGYTVEFRTYTGALIITKTQQLGFDDSDVDVSIRVGYIFDGWFTASSEEYRNDDQLPGNIVVYEHFTASISYTVEFRDVNGTLLKTQSVVSGQDATPPIDPSYYGIGYTFTGWSVPYTNITADTTIYAEYEILSFAVQFKNWNGTILKLETVNYGSDATAPTDPTRTGYTFSGWDVAYTDITADLIVTAEYTINSFTVEFRDYNGFLIKTQVVNYGSNATPPSSPARLGYTFTGWSDGYTNITSDITLYAQYTINSFTVTFYDHEGISIDEQTINYGYDATAPDAPARTGYTFTGWSIDYTNVTSDLSVTAQYIINSFTVEFRNYNGALINTQIVSYGSDATAPASPTRTGYTFTGWSIDYTNVSQSVVTYAEYTINTFTVVFQDWDESVLKTETVNYGTSATPPTDPTRVGYEFYGWSGTYTNITASITLTAQYSQGTYDVVFRNINGDLITTVTVEYGANATPPVDPTYPGLTFTGWSGSYENITASITLYATYDALTYTITFVDWDETTVLKTETVNYGADATPPVDPTRTGYTFTGWSGSYENATSNQTITATYTINGYTVTFRDYNGALLKTEVVNYGSDATPPNPTRIGYTFSSWVDVNLDPALYSNITASITLYAHYTVSVNSVTFKNFDDTVYLVQSVNYNGFVSLPTYPTRAGFVFQGWYTTVSLDVLYAFSTPVTQDTVLFPKWAASESGGGIIIEPAETATFSTTNIIIVATLIVLALGIALVPNKKKGSHKK